MASKNTRKKNKSKEKKTNITQKIKKVNPDYDTIWFSNKNIKKYKKIFLYNLHGLVLPHAGTSYSGEIISHTLRFQPKKEFENIVILYLPASSKPDIKDQYHEYIVPYQCLKVIYPNKKFIGYNMLSNKNPNLEKIGINLKNTFFIISADFSHFLPFNNAIKQENCAARSLMFNQYNIKCVNTVDHKNTFEFFFNKYPNLVLDWVGRTRSPGKKGVGYLSFLIREKINLKMRKPDGFFVTAYDSEMRARECLGDLQGWDKSREIEKVKNVLKKARTTSRLTGGKYIDVPVNFYQITYLFKKKTKKFIRGWHSILSEAFYLSEVFLENTFEDGKWIKNHDEWKTDGYNFDLKDTFGMLYLKGMGSKLSQEQLNIMDTNVYLKDYKLFTSEKIFIKI